MVKHDLSELRQRLRAIHAEMGRLVTTFSGRAPLLKAYLQYQPRTCGNPGCKCAGGELHPAWIVQFADGAERRCRSVRSEVYRELEKPAEAYRRFRRARARWNRLVKEANAVVSEMEKLRSMDPKEAVEGK